MFGVPPMMAKRSPQLDRSTSRALDIGNAQRNWRLDYDSTPMDFFIGVGPLCRRRTPGGTFFGGMLELRPCAGTATATANGTISVVFCRRTHKSRSCLPEV